MAILPIYLYGADVLRKKAKPVRELDDMLIELIHIMFETMYHAGGIGFAANQVGDLNRVIVIDISDTEEGKATKPMVLINPEVVSKEGESSLEEGCLSIPGVRDIVSRPKNLTIKFKDGDFQDASVEAPGLLGRVIQHEIDHLNGVLFTDHLSPAKRRAHKAQLDAIRKGEIDVSYPVVVPDAVPK
jgi:peptide deformylase